MCALRKNVSSTATSMSTKAFVRHPIFTNFARRTINDVPSNVKARPSVDVFWNAEQSCNKKSFIAVVQFSCDQTLNISVLSQWYRILLLSS